MIVINWE